MISSTTAQQPAQQFHIQAHQPLVLTHPEALWQLKTGELAVFATRMAGETPIGARRYLFTVQAGEALFGVEPQTPQEALGGLIAVPLEPSEVTYQELPLDGDTNPDLDTLRQLSDRWLQRFNEVQGWGGVPKSVQKSAIIPDYHYLSLLEDQTCRPKAEQVLWISMRRGEAHWMGNADFPMVSALGCFPVGDRAYFEATGDIEFYARSTFEVRNRKILIKGVAQFHRYFLQRLTQIEAKAVDAERRRFLARQQLDHEATQSTVQDLAA
ncbi:MAG: NHLP bacteriocin export ABC transporter permease/ATPase subunit, partial [Cyanobacteria bacterium P01_D01_bin.128]